MTTPYTYVFANYALADNWEGIVEEVRSGQRLPPNADKKMWTIGKHNLNEKSRSWIIILFLLYQLTPQLSHDDLFNGITNAFPFLFQDDNNTPKAFAQQFVRELIKMGIIVGSE